MKTSRPLRRTWALPRCMVLSCAVPVLLGLLSLACPARATPDLRFDSFERFTVEDGLPHTRVHKIAQSRQGFLWIATQNGLARFDGYQFRTFENRQDDSTSLGNNYVKDLYEDAEGSLWIATYGGGLDRFDPATGIFHHYRHDSEDPQRELRDSLNSIAASPDGHLWVSSNLGLSAVDPIEKRLVPWTGTASFPSPRLPQTILSLLWNREGAGWILTEKALFQLDPGQGHGRSYHHASQDPQGLPFAPVEGGLYEDASGRLWLFGLGGLARYSSETHSFSAIHLGSSPAEVIPVLSVYEDRRGHIWIGTVGHGLICLDHEDQIVAHYRHHPSDDRSLGNDIIFSIFEDRTGVLWFGTNGGLDQLNPERQAFARYGYDPANPKSPRGEVLAVQQDQEGRLWLGTFGQGLVEMDHARTVAHHFRHDPVDPQSLSHDFVWALHEDHIGQLWVGTEVGADRLARTANNTVIRHYRHDPEVPQTLTAGRVLVFFEDSAKILWLATVAGLNRYDRETETFQRYSHEPANPESLGKSSILAIAEHPPGILWLGTDGGGLERFDTQTHRVVRYLHDRENRSGLSANIISALHWDAQGRLWIATLGGGLECFDPQNGTFLHHRKENGFPTNSLSSILPDAQGNLWLSHKSGLIRFEPPGGEVRTFDSSDGLLRGGFNLKAAHRSPENELFFGGSKGFIAFSPEQVSLDLYPPTVAITSLEILNHPVALQHIDPSSPLKGPIEQTRSLVLEHQHQSLSLEFSALHFANPQSNQYAYMLEGIDSTWRPTSASKRFAQYSNLPPGQYTFRVRASNNNGVWSAQDATLALRVKPPLWRTWWAFTLYVTIVGLALASFIHNQKQKVARERAISERLRQVDRLKDEFLANTSHELRTPLHGMVGLAESVLDGIHGAFPREARGTLQMIVTSGQRLSHLVNDILDFSKLRQRSLDLRLHPVDLATAADVVLTVLGPVAANKGLELIHAVPRDLPHVFADENRLQQILYNLVGNAIKFTSHGKVKVDAVVRKGLLETCVSDTGPGIPEKEHQRIFDSFERVLEADSNPGGTGLGLAITRKLVELHGGQVSVESAPDQGSTFRFTLPIAGSELVSSIAPQRQEIPIVQSAPEIVAPTLLTRPVTEGTKAHILIVDDEPINRRVLHNHLGLRHFQVTEAADGQQALDLVRKQGAFDLILLDLMMPGLSGYEVCRQIRLLQTRQELPVIFLTARGREADLAQGLAVGANDYLIKPVSKAELMARVEMHLDLLEAHRHLDRLVTERTAQLKMLRGLLPMCSGCKKIRDDDGYWSEVETYLDHYSEAEVTHGMCPECAFKIYPDFYRKRSKPA